MIRQLMSRFIFVAIIFFLPFILIAQNKESGLRGVISGSVKDTALNYFMQSATVSVYSGQDKKLIVYILTNSLGEFYITSLPTNIGLEIRITYIGYETYSKQFLISPEKKILNFGEVDLRRNDSVLESVTITPPPVRMHGDTLEFSAEAFKLDTNSVAEDLLRKLPGVIVWGDGTITVNGKQISKLLVDGKPFFGGDAIIATQNIPKSAIDKVQVYQEYIDPNNPLDSITAINLKLRKNHHSGYFGSLYAGASTNGNYDAGINNNIFTPKDQFALVAQTNNVNKKANDINTILRNNTFKGVTARVEYQPDFTIPGVNQQTSGGAIFSHDFIPEFDQYKKNRFSINTFLNHNFNNTINHTETISSIGIDSNLQQNSYTNNKAVTNEININSKYNKLKLQDSLIIEGNYNLRKTDAQNLLQNQTLSPAIGLISDDNQIDSLKNTLSKIEFYGGYFHHGFYNSSTDKLTNWSVIYSISNRNENSNKFLQSKFSNIYTPNLNQFFDRKYDSGKNVVSQNLNMSLGDFSTWLFNKNRILSRFHIDLNNELQWNFEKQNNLVQDGDTLNKLYTVNNYLSKTGSYKVVTETPFIRIGKSFLNALANRYQKEFSITLDSKIQFSNQNNSSDHEFQNYIANYHCFIPVLKLNYYNFQYGEYLNNYDFEFNKSVDYPTPNQRFPLVDSSAIYTIREGNPRLRQENKYEVTLRFRHSSFRSKNTFIYGANMNAGITNNYFADSVIVNSAGQYIYYTTNLNGNRFLNVSLFFNKAFIYGVNQFQLNIATAIGGFRNPGYIGYQSTNESGLNISNIYTNSDSISILYNYKDFLAINILQKISYYISSQNGFTNAEFKNIQTSTRLGIGLNITKKFSINSNASYNWSAFSNTPSIKYTIWNAFLSYRFMKANNFELKLSALDILNQNKGIINSGNNYSFTHGTVNLLHQYFMATISYFPRKFGKKSTVK